MIEILSPKTARFDKGVKRETYARTGVKELWIVNPELREIQVYHLDKDADVPAATYGEGQKFESPLLPGLKIPVAKVFEQ